MIESTFKTGSIVVIISCLILSVVLIIGFLLLAGSALPLYASVPVFLFMVSMIAWLVCVELRTKAVKVKIDGNMITVKNFIGLGSAKTYDLKEFDGYKISILPSEYKEYEYLYLFINYRKQIKISQFYHNNYAVLKEAISRKTKNLGKENFSLLREVREIFIFK